MGWFLADENQGLSAWEQYKRPLRGFARMQSIIREIFSGRRSWVIVGPPGVGKSAFLLWGVAAALEKNDLRPWQPWFKHVVFLNPHECQSWGKDLIKFDPATTLLAIDAPFRRKLQQNEILGTLATIHSSYDSELGEGGPFEFVVTLRPEERIVLQQGPSSLQPFHVYEVSWDEETIWLILDTYLERQGVRVASEGTLDVRREFYEKSQGRPFYCEQLASHLKSTKQVFDPAKVALLPPGIVNLHLDVLQKNCTSTAVQDPLFSIISLLAETHAAFSETFVDCVIDNEELVAKNQRGSVREAWNLLATVYMIKEEKAAAKFIRLDPEWSETFHSVADGLAGTDPYFHTQEHLRKSWRGLSHFMAVTASFILDRLLRDGIRRPNDFLLCADLARLGDEHAIKALELWLGNSSVPEIAPSLGIALTAEFYEALLARAFSAKEEGDIARAEKNFDAAFKVLKHKAARFDIHDVIEHVHAKKDLMSYIGMLRTRLQQATNVDEIKYKIIGVFEDLIAIDRKDKLSLAHRAKFRQDVGEYAKAEEDFKAAEAIPSEDALVMTSVIHAYAVFLSERGDSVWWTNPEDASARFMEARKLFEKGLMTLDEALLKNVPNRDRIQETKVTFLNALAISLFREARKQSDRTTKRRLNAEAVKRLRDALKIEPLNTRSTNLLAQNLIKFGWTLPEYRGKKGQPFRDARDLLERALKRQGETQDPFTLRILGRVLYLSPMNEQDFENAKKYLEDSARRGGERYRPLVNYELANLYREWAGTCGRDSPLGREKLQSARDFLNRAAEVITEPYYAHLISVYISQAQLCLYANDKEQAEQWLKKLDELPKLAERVVRFSTKPLDLVLGEFGDDFLEEAIASAKEQEHQQASLQVAKWCFERATVANVQSWYPPLGLARCFQRADNSGSFLYWCGEATKRARTAAAWASIRNAINEEKKKLPSETRQRSSYEQAMLDNSEEAYKAKPHYWKNCADYSEDLLVSGQFEEAIRVANEARQLFVDEVRRARRTEEGRYWIKGTSRETRSRLKSTLAKAFAGVAQFDKAGKYLWSSALLENKERGWYEFARVASGLLKTPRLDPFSDTAKVFARRFWLAFEKYLQFVENTRTNKRQREPDSGLSRLVRLVGHARDLSSVDKSTAALAAKYFEVLRFLRSDSLGTTRPKAEWFGLTGNWLLTKLYEYHFCFECLLNAVRLGKESRFRYQNLRQLGESAEYLGHSHVALESYREAQKLEDDSSRWPTLLFKIQAFEGEKATPTSSLEEAVISEVRGENSHALEFYRSMVASEIRTLDKEIFGAFSISESLRISIDALIIQGDLRSANLGCTKLLDLVVPPESLCLKCLDFHLSSGARL